MPISYQATQFNLHRVLTFMIKKCVILMILS